MIYLEDARKSPIDKRYYRIMITLIIHHKDISKNANVVLKKTLPSKSLLHWYRELSDNRFEDFRINYINELNNNPHTVGLIKGLTKASASNFIILYDSKRSWRIAQALRDYLRILLGQPPVKSAPTTDRILNYLYNDPNGDGVVSMPETCKALAQYNSYLKKHHIKLTNNHIIYHGAHIRHRDLISLLLSIQHKEVKNERGSKNK